MIVSRMHSKIWLTMEQGEDYNDKEEKVKKSFEGFKF